MIDPITGDHVVETGVPVVEDRAVTLTDVLLADMDAKTMKLSINVQAEYMGMRIFNNRKRMRKRVRQHRRQWSPFDDHWASSPTGDW